MQISRDQFLSDRFDQRMRVLFEILIPAHGLLIVAEAMIDGRIAAALIHGTMAVLAWIMLRRIRDMISFLIFTHVYWTFSFLTYAFSLMHGNLASFGLGDAERSALVALVSQSGLFLVSFLAPALPPKPDDGGRKTLQLASDPVAFNILLALGMLGLASRLFGLLPPVYGSTLILLLYVAIAFRLLSRPQRTFSDPLLIGLSALIAVVAIKSNARTDLLSLILMLGFAAIMMWQRVLTVRNILLAVLTWGFVRVFSAIVLASRWARSSDQSMIALFEEKFFSLDTLMTLINPFHTPQVQLDYLATSAPDLYGFYTPFFDGDVGVLSRLTMLPQMDIVVSRLREVERVDWGQIWNTVLSALPSFGQEKMLILSDTVVWGLGLRSIGSVGRPMITAEGEIYAIGGSITVFVIIALTYWVLNWWYRKIAITTGSRVAAVLIWSQMLINTVMSTTFLSILAGSFRAPLQLFLVLCCVYLLAGYYRSIFGVRAYAR